MISLLQRKGFKLFHPVLKRLAKVYLSKPRNYSYKGIIVKVLPGVFHPGLFFSTKVFIEFLETVDLRSKKVLELGAGSGLISLYCAQQQAIVTASDVNTVAINGLKENATQNNQELSVVLSDLFDNLSPDNFDIILINPPYYPKKPKNIEEQAWFCGEEFEYFKKLFGQLRESKSSEFVLYMILSEDCDLVKIKSIAESNNISSDQVYTKRIRGEENFIFEMRKNSTHS